MIMLLPLEWRKQHAGRRHTGRGTMELGLMVRAGFFGRL
jgi:hypothetical protein